MDTQENDERDDLVSDHEVVALVQGLKTWRASARDRTMRRIRPLGSQAVVPLIELLHEEARRRWRYRLLYSGAYFAYVGLLIAVLAFHLDVVQLLVVMPVFVGLAFVIMRLRSATGTQIAATQLLAGMDDVRAVGPLAEALWFQDLVRGSYTPRAAAEALTRLLPRLRATDAALLTPHQRACLNGLLGMSYAETSLELLHIGRSWAIRVKRLLSVVDGRKTTDLLVAILQAWQQVGDTDALPNVQRLVDSDAKTHNQLRVQEAARACLPFLRQRAAVAQPRQTLLRPVEAPDAPSAILVRPAEGSAEVEAQRLLRPTTREETP